MERVMTTPRQFLLADSYDAAIALDNSIVWAHGMTNCNAWAGVSVRSDGQFGVFYDAKYCAFLLPSFELDTEVLDKDGASNWSDYVPPVVAANLEGAP
jgi:hypothetical protein